MGKKSRTKGATAELEVCAILREVFPDVQRDLDQVRGHNNGRDLIGTGKWCFQVKRRAKMTRGVIEAGYREAVTAAAKGSNQVIVIHRSDREEWMVSTKMKDLFWLGYATPKLITFSLSDFVSMIREDAA